MSKRANLTDYFVAVQGKYNKGELVKFRGLYFKVMGQSSRELIKGSSVYYMTSLTKLR
jgi:hypothetical protein